MKTAYLSGTDLPRDAYFSISDHQLGAGYPCLIIGEVAQAHDGSLGMAHAFIDAIASAGADAVKFQAHIAAAESTPSEPWRVKFSSQDITRYDYWKRMEFTLEQWQGLAEHARQRGLLFLCSPFSIDAVELLLKTGIPAWKIASGEVTNIPMLERITETKLPVLLSSGMSTLDEIDRNVAWFRENELPFALFQCTSAYPVHPKKVGLNMIPFFRERYECPVGLSDHSGTIYPSLAAVTLGCNLLEIHVTLSREMFGPDVISSVTTCELKQIVEGVRFIESALISPVDKDAVAQELAQTRRLFTKSIVARMNLNAGTVLREEHIILKKPGTGIPVSRLPEVIGRHLARDVIADQLLDEKDLEENQ